MDQYIGAEKIALVVEVENKKTPAGEMLVSVTFDNGRVEVMPKKRLEMLSSQESNTNPTHIVKNHVGSLIYSLLNEYGLKMGEINYAVDGAIELANNGFKKSSEVLFGSEYSDITLLQVNDILLKNLDGNKTA